MSGAASAVIVERNPSFHVGRPPVKAHADCAATLRQRTPRVGMITGVSMTADRQCCSDEEVRSATDQQNPSGFDPTILNCT